jgi:hypothetical protein
MKLQENIERIREIMGGVITEDRKEMFIKNMIDEIGIENTIKMVGGYDEVEPYLSDEDKVNYIKEKVLEIADKFGSNGVILSAPQGRPLKIKEDYGIIYQIEFLGQSRARVESYETGVYHKGYVINYEDMSPQMKDIVIKRLLEY